MIHYTFNSVMHKLFRSIREMQQIILFSYSFFIKSSIVYFSFKDFNLNLKERE